MKVAPRALRCHLGTEISCGLLGTSSFKGNAGDLRKFRRQTTPRWRGVDSRSEAVGWALRRSPPTPPCLPASGEESASDGKCA